MAQDHDYTHCDTCPFHLSEVQRVDNQKERIVGTEKCLADLKKEFLIMDKKLLIIGNDLKYIKTPMSIIAGAVVLYIAGALLKLIPYTHVVEGITK